MIIRHFKTRLASLGLAGFLLTSASAHAQTKDIADVATDEDCLPYTIHVRNILPANGGNTPTLGYSRVVDENQRYRVFLERVGDLSQEAFVRVTSSGITAEPNVDFVPWDVTIRFPPKSSSIANLENIQDAEFTIQVLDGGVDEHPEVVQIVLTGPGTQPPGSNDFIFIDDKGLYKPPYNTPPSVLGYAFCPSQRVSWGNTSSTSGKCSGLVPYGVSLPMAAQQYVVVNDKTQSLGYMHMLCNYEGKWKPFTNYPVLEKRYCEDL